MRLKSSFLLAAFGLLCASASADPVIIDFEGVVPDDNVDFNITMPHVESGFSLSRSQEGEKVTAIASKYRGSNQPSPASSVFWWSVRPPTPTILTLQTLSGSPFSFHSLQIGQINDVDYDLPLIRIIGYLAAGGTVSQDIDPTNGAWTTWYLDPEFTNLSKVTIGVTAPVELGKAATMDKLCLSVPEPSTLLLLSGGIGLVALFRKRMG